MGMYVGVVYRREYLRHVSDYVPIVCGYLYLCVVIGLATLLHNIYRLYK